MVSRLQWWWEGLERWHGFTKECKGGSRGRNWVGPNNNRKCNMAPNGKEQSRWSGLLINV